MKWDLNMFVIIGYIGQLIFGMRFVVQWIASEKAKNSVVPFSFWILSVCGSSLLLIYAVYRRDPVFILGQLPNVIIYLRNIYLIKKRKREGEER